MQDMRRRLPHLDPLIAFEAAARHGSFKLAAQELCVTASAVSQQIRALEAQLNVTLFQRGHRSVHLSEQGEAFRKSVVLALSHLANAADELRVGEGKERLGIATDTSFAAHWLMPRLPRFTERHPGISLRIMVTDVRDDLLGEGVQVAVVHGQGNWPGHVTEPLFDEEVFPVCAPEYLSRWEGAFGLEDLVRADLLDLDYEKWDWMNWAIWLTERGVSLPEGPRTLSMNSYPLLIDAARRGAGVALAWRHLVDDDLARGVLVRPVQASVKTSFGYHIASAFNATSSRATSAFIGWLLDERDRQP